MLLVIKYSSIYYLYSTIVATYKVHLLIGTVLVYMLRSCYNVATSIQLVNSNQCYACMAICTTVSMED